MPADVATTIMEAIHAADPWCLARCAASNVTSLKPCEDYQGGLAFQVNISPGQIHTITIRPNPQREYEVMLSRIYLDATQRLETVTCPAEALASVIKRMSK